MTAVWLYYVEDMPARDIAAVLGRCRAAVKTILFRARRRLLPLLEPLQSGASRGRCAASRDRKTPLGAPRMEVPHA